MRLKIRLVALFLTVIISCISGNRNVKHTRHSTTTEGENSLIVQTTKGKLLGKHDQTDKGVRYVTFQGIPYAKPPLNELRFELPEEFAWEGTWNATYERDECVQAFPGFLLPVRGREDCLHINIYTRNLGNDKNLKPVMVWIYGGSFVFGSGSKNYYGPDYFIERDVVVVTFNYRLGIFGFLSTGDEISPGNLGLKDQIFALKWIQENIASFGGDPKKVTIMGESAGAVSVGLLIQSDLAKGLFQQGVLQSGTSIYSMVPRRKVKRAIGLLAKAFEVTSGNSKDLVDKLKTVDYTTLLLYSVVITENTKETIFDNNLFTPVLENQSHSAVVTKPLFEQLEKCQFHSIPVVVGFTSEEMLSYQKLLDDQRYKYIIYDQNPENLVPKNLNVKDRCNAKDIGTKIKEHYVGKNGSFVYSPNGIIRYMSDTALAIDSMVYAKMYSKCNENAYLYRFSYNGGKNTTGAGHAEELRYLFSTFPNIQQREPLSETDTIVSNNMVDLWSNFIKFGNPTPSNKLGVIWNKNVRQNNYEYLDIDEKLTTGNNANAPFRKDLEFWEGLYRMCGRIDVV